MNCDRRHGYFTLDLRHTFLISKRCAFSYPTASKKILFEKFVCLVNGGKTTRWAIAIERDCIVVLWQPGVASKYAFQMEHKNIY